MTRANKKSVSMTTNWGTAITERKRPMVEAKMMTVKKSRMVFASRILLLPVMPSVSAPNTLGQAGADGCTDHTAHCDGNRICNHTNR